MCVREGEGRQGKRHACRVWGANVLKCKYPNTMQKGKNAVCCLAAHEWHAAVCGEVWGMGGSAGYTTGKEARVRV